MSSVAEFTIPPKSFPFGRTLLEMPDVEIEVDQIVPTDESAFPFFWVSGCDPGEFMEVAEREPEIRNARELESVDHKALFRAEWTPNVDVVAGLKDLDVTIVEAVGTAESWRFEVRTENRDSFGRLRDVFEAEGIPIDLIRIYDLEDVLEDQGGSITEAQRETLLAAYDGGYFDVPKGTTQRELGARFGVSPRSVSERLRRGTRNLVRDVLVKREGA